MGSKFSIRRKSLFNKEAASSSQREKDRSQNQKTDIIDENCKHLKAFAGSRTWA